MKKCLFPFVIFNSLVSSAIGRGQDKRNLREIVSSNATTTITPDLWGSNGANWDPVNSLLRDFTDVGYNLSNSAIPDSWPIYMNVTNLASANDELSDLAAFQNAIDNCPDFHAIGVPNGRYIIDGPLNFTCNNCVLRGESRDGVVLYFPKHMDEILDVKTTKMSNPFILMRGGSNRGIEHLSLVLRDEKKATGYWIDPKLTKQVEEHWYYSGERMILMDGNIKDSWVRNVYIKNSNDGIIIQNRWTTRISIIDVIIDQFPYRKYDGVSRYEAK